MRKAILSDGGYFLKKKDFYRAILFLLGAIFPVRVKLGLFNISRHFFLFFISLLAIFSHESKNC
ncbi:MAG: hypothetical protein CMQ40_04540 [Gammaproteobacteria bacterium]|nr:hypothetical protein [Gammaproteobacteria bacterium]